MNRCRHTHREINGVLETFPKECLKFSYNYLQSLRKTVVNNVPEKQCEIGHADKQSHGDVNRSACRPVTETRTGDVLVYKDQPVSLAAGGDMQGNNTTKTSNCNDRNKTRTIHGAEPQIAEDDLTILTNASADLTSAL